MEEGYMRNLMELDERFSTEAACMEYLQKEGKQVRALSRASRFTQACPVGFGRRKCPFPLRGYRFR